MVNDRVGVGHYGGHDMHPRFAVYQPKRRGRQLRSQTIPKIQPLIKAQAGTTAVNVPQGLRATPPVRQAGEIVQFGIVATKQIVSQDWKNCLSWRENPKGKQALTEQNRPDELHLYYAV
jgi:hypothetical protein